MLGAFSIPACRSLHCRQCWLVTKAKVGGLWRLVPLHVSCPPCRHPTAATVGGRGEMHPPHPASLSPFHKEPQLSTALLSAWHIAQTSCLSPTRVLFWGESHVNGSREGSKACPCARAGTFPVLPPPRNLHQVPSLPPSRPSGQVTLRWLCFSAQLQSED